MIRAIFLEMQFSSYQKSIQEPSMPSYASEPKFLCLPFQISAQHPVGPVSELG